MEGGGRVEGERKSEREGDGESREEEDKRMRRRGVRSDMEGGREMKGVQKWILETDQSEGKEGRRREERKKSWYFITATLAL